MIDHPYVEARQISSSIEQTLLSCSCARHNSHIFMPTHYYNTKFRVRNLNSGITINIYECTGTLAKMPSCYQKIARTLHVLFL